GILLGAAALPPTPSTGSTGLARLTPGELARQAGIPEDVARQMLEIADRLDAYSQSVAGRPQGGRGRPPPPPQFEAMRQEARDLIDFLESRLPAIAAQLGGRNMSASSIAASLAAARARVNAMTYSARPTVTALLPEATPGLTRVGQTDTWVYPR